MTRHLRVVAVAMALTLVSITATSSSAEPDNAAPFRVEQAELDLGTVVAGSIATATFVFHNDGPEDVHIIRAKPS